MRVLRPIVHALVLAMLHGKAHLRPRGAVGTELVRDHDAGRRGCRLQELCHEPLRRAAVSAALDQDVEDKAILIDGAPEPMLLARDRDEDFVQMPFVAARGSPLADLISEPLAELLSPLAHGLVGHANPAGQYLLDHAQAQGKPEVEPNRIPDDFRRKAMAAIEGFTSARHGSAYATIRSRSVKLTVPCHSQSHSQPCPTRSGQSIMFFARVSSIIISRSLSSFGTSSRNFNRTLPARLPLI